jgi:NAD(P)-dependent dehydrogenase (short-subunit alcohol dehydrogenase family)
MTSTANDFGGLEGKVALVTGASRGAGRAIAIALGQAGAVVWLTGRSTSGKPTTDGMPGTIDDTTFAIRRAGGEAHPLRCDHTNDDDVEAAIDRIEQKHGAIDVLVNNVWGGYEAHDMNEFVAPFWKQPMKRRWSAMFEAGLRAHLFCAMRCAPAMIEKKRGLIVSTVAWDRGEYLGNLFYDVAKASIVRLISGMARELRPHDVAAIAVAPGFMRTERVMAAHRRQPFDLSRTESPTYVARAVVALAKDKENMKLSGDVVSVGDLARKYDFRDEDGSQPEPFRIG